MNKNYLKTILVLFVLILIYGCSDFNNNTVNNDVNNGIINNGIVDNQNFNTSNVDSILKYKNSFVGDNVAVSQIISLLPMGEYKDSVGLDTDELPYKIEIEYRKQVISKYKDFKNISENNALIIFALINNVDLIEIDIDDVQKILYIRGDMVSKYGNQYGDKFQNIVNNSNSLSEFIESYNK